MVNIILENMFGGIFKNKKVFVTGHTGFQGSWLSLWLRLLGAKVIGYSLRPPTKPSLFEVLRLNEEIKHIVGDVRDHSFLQRCMIKNKPDIVFHLAAQPLVRLSYQKPIDTFHTNVLGTVNVLDAIRHTPTVRSGIIITSDKCYENNGWVFAYRENDQLGGHDPYSASKGAAEIITTSYSRSFFNSKKNTKIGISTVRAGNVIGGGDWAQDRIIPDCMRSLFVKKPIQVRNPKAIRPWQHVLEPISGMLLLAQKLLGDPESYNGAWNFGPNTSLSFTVEFIVKKILKEWKRTAKWEDVSKRTKNTLHEAKYLKIDSTKASARLGWQTIYSIDETINETISWYWNYLERNDMRKFTESQIRTYTQKAKHMNVDWAITG